MVTGRPRPRPSAPPAYQPARGGSHLISAKAWNCLALAFPDFVDDRTQERWYEPVPYQSLKELGEAVQKWGPNGHFTQAILRRISSQALTPADWMDLAKACLSGGQFLEFKSLAMDLAQKQARKNFQQGQQWWTADMLLGQGDFTANQTNYPPEVHQQVNEIHYKAWTSVSKKGEAQSRLTKVTQGRLEPFTDFVTRMMEAAEKIVGNSDVAMPFVMQIIYEQSTGECQKAINPVRNKGMDSWLHACRGVGGPLTNEGLTAAILVASKSPRTRGEKACFRCTMSGHLKRHCPVGAEGSEPPPPAQQQRQPGTCL